MGNGLIREPSATAVGPVYLQIRRGGFQNPSPWGPRGDPYQTLADALRAVYEISEMAFNGYNCCIDYQITDEQENIIRKG